MACAALLGIAALAGCQTEPDDAFSLQARDAMTSALAARFRTDPSTLEVRSFGQVVWTDDCYGIAQDRACSPGTHFGYRLQSGVDGVDYTYHASAEDPFRIMLVEGPDPEIGLPALDAQWVEADGTCHSLQIAHDGLPAIGLCGGPHAAHALLEEMERPEEWRYLLDRFAPFELAAEDHAVSFHGLGAETAPPAWQSAVSTWASLQWAEIQAGRTGAAWGRMLAVQRPVAERPGDCHFVEVTQYGRAFVSLAACGGGDAELAGSTWIDDEAWERLAAWYLEWSPIYDTQQRIEFYGTGAAAVGEAEKAQLAQVADDIVRRSAGTPASPPTPLEVRP
jgi:hypothetical protein